MRERIDRFLSLDAEGAATEARTWASGIAGLPRDAAESALRELLQTLELEGQGLFPCPPDAVPANACRLANILCTLRALRDRALPALGEPPPDAAAEVRRETVWIRRIAPKDFEGLQILEVLHDHLDRVRVEEIRSLVEARTAQEKPGRLLQRIAYEQIQLRERGRHDLVEELTRHRVEFWQQITAHVAEDQDDLESYLRGLCDDICDRSEDRLSEIEHLDDDLAFFAMGLATADVEEATQVTKPLGFKRPIRDLKRLRVRLFKAFQDKTVRSKQVAQVGLPRLKGIERGILFLIILVLGLLIFTLTSDPDLERDRLLDRVDLGICVAFLAEFTWRLLLAPGKLYYFRRYALVDFLPSLPFGLILDAPTSRAAKATRGARLVRLLRPFRLLAFAVRGMDRLIRRYSQVLNRNVVMFQPEAEETQEEQGWTARLSTLEERLERTLRVRLGAEASNVRRNPLLHLVQTNVIRLQDTPAVGGRDFLQQSTDIHETRLEDLIRNLQDTEPEDVEDRLGRDGAERVRRFLRFLDFPILRSMPLIRSVVSGLREPEALTAMAHAAQGLGRSLERFLDTLRFYGDLRGIITGPQILDRVGSALVRMTQRPAMRLILFGLLFAILSGVLGLFPSVWLEGMLERYVSPLVEALLIVGGVCLVVQIFGRWLKHIAGEAGDMFRRIAEAQSINLLKLHKQDSKVHDLELIFGRVLREEAHVDPDVPDDWLERLRAEFVSHVHEGAPDDRRLNGFRLQTDRVLLLYQDYLDGAVLHHSDVKTTEQFLGNLDLMAIRRERLAMSRSDLKALLHLDMTKDRALPGGPSLWFQFITESLAEMTARLVLEYDLNAVPLAHRDRVPPHRIEAMNLWLERSLRSSQKKRNRQLLSSRATSVHRFSSLHFLVADPDRDRQVAAEFGPEVLERLREDRQAMIRGVFGTYPFETLPRLRRTLNPYTHYFRWFGRGLFLLLPLRLLWRGLVISGRSMMSLFQIIREQLYPHKTNRDPRANWSTLQVAWRKVNRMRRPVFMAALELRTQFDPQYLHAPLPGGRKLDDAFQGLVQDLDLIGASTADHRRYRRKMARATEHMAKLESFLREAGWPKCTLREILDPESQRPSAQAEEDEALRAVAIAWHLNYKSCRTLLQARQHAEETLRAALDDPQSVKPRKRLTWSRTSRAFERFLSRSTDLGTEAGQKEVLRGAVAEDYCEVRASLLALEGAGGDATARASGMKILAEVARYPMPWSQQLVTLRAVQTLTCLDVINTRRVVADLGRFDQ